MYYTVHTLYQSRQPIANYVKGKEKKKKAVKELRVDHSAKANFDIEPCQSAHRSSWFNRSFAYKVLWNKLYELDRPISLIKENKKISIQYYLQQI